jgi:phospholipase/carboxylesterase
LNPMYPYDIHMPANPVPGKTYPTIFTLHGKGSNEKNMFGLVAPLSEDFIIVGIRGNLPLGAGYQYYDLKSLGNPIREMFDEAVTELEAFIMPRINIRLIRAKDIYLALAKVQFYP